jgi:hypothetical protein
MTVQKQKKLCPSNSIVQKPNSQTAKQKEITPWKSSTDFSVFAKILKTFFWGVFLLLPASKTLP